MIVAPTQSEAQTVLRAFLLAILPTGVEVIEGQPNRVPEPAADDFVVMTAIARHRLRTNIDELADATYIGSIAGTVLTVSSVTRGTVREGSTVFGPVTPGTRIESQISGPPGGAGTYRITLSQTVAGPASFAGGQIDVTQGTEITYQLDVHGPASADNAATITTLARDAYATEFFAEQSSTVAPLHADDGRQMPFLNENQQVETRWIVEFMLQVNQTVSVPQQFADSVSVDLIDVDVVYPPT